MDKYTIQIADTDKKKHDVLAFWAINFPRWPQNKFPWFYESNPYGKATIWMGIDNESEKVIGSIAIFPRAIYIEGKKYMAGIKGDLGVHVDHRKKGPAQLFQDNILATYKNDFDILYGFPNQRSEKAMIQKGYETLGNAAWMVKIIDSSKKYHNLLKIKPLAMLFSLPTNWWLKLSSKENKYKTTDKFSTEVITRFDERFDKLWEKGHAHHCIIGERSSAFLNWRFAECPYRDYLAFTLSDNSNVVGYIVYQITDNSVNIADIFAINKDQMLDNLLAEFLLYLREKKITIVSMVYFGDNHLIKKLQEFKFFNRSESRRFMIHRGDKESVPKVLGDGNQWYFVEGDNDISTS